MCHRLDSIANICIKMFLLSVKAVALIFIFGRGSTISSAIDVPRPLTNDLWVFLFQPIDAECVK